MQKGFIHKWFSEKGFGFIESVDDNRWFFPRSSIIGDEITEGDEVEFETGPGRREGETIAIRVCKAGTQFGLQSGAPVEPRRLFVFGFNRENVESDLEAFFSQIGEVEKVEICHSDNGESRCFGFITMKTEFETLDCIARAHGVLWCEGRPLTVRPAVRSRIARRA
jgi:RNA recognition motif-containing protein